jgi:hypothetical protein
VRWDDPGDFRLVRRRLVAKWSVPGLSSCQCQCQCQCQWRGSLLNLLVRSLTFSLVSAGSLGGNGFWRVGGGKELRLPQAVSVSAECSRLIIEQLSVPVSVSMESLSLIACAQLEVFVGFCWLACGNGCWRVGGGKELRLPQAVPVSVQNARVSGEALSLIACAQLDVFVGFSRLAWRKRLLACRRGEKSFGFPRQCHRQCGTLAPHN